MNPTVSSNTPATRRCAGFTLVDLMATLAVASVLSGVAYPSFTAQLHKAHRADALVAMVQVQTAQERWRSSHRQYGSLADIGMAAQSPAGHYTLAVADTDDERYVVLASAAGAQAGDRACRHLKLTLDGANLVYASGADTATNNPAVQNRRCWNL